MKTETRSRIEALLKTKTPSEPMTTFYLRNKEKIKVSKGTFYYHVKGIQHSSKPLKVQKVKIGEITPLISTKMEIVIGNITLKPLGNSVTINGNKIEW